MWSKVLQSGADTRAAMNTSLPSVKTGSILQIHKQQFGSLIEIQAHARRR